MFGLHSLFCHLSAGETKTTNEHFSDSHLYFTKTKLNFHFIFPPNKQINFCMIKWHIHAQTKNFNYLLFELFNCVFSASVFISISFSFLIFESSFFPQCSLQPDASNSDYFNVHFSLEFWSRSCPEFQLTNVFIEICSPFRNIPHTHEIVWVKLSMRSKICSIRFRNVSIFGFIFFVALFFLEFIHWNYLRSTIKCDC